MVGHGWARQGRVHQRRRRLLRDRTARTRLIIGSSVLVGVVLLALLTTTSFSTPTIEVSIASPPAGGRCLLLLHGKGGSGTATATVDGVTVVAPDGNGSGWGGREWDYFSSAEAYAEAHLIAARAVDGCDQIIVDGFSNGGSFAAKMLCAGETFHQRLVRVVLDDPVPDEAVVGCQADLDVAVDIYWTGALDYTRPDFSCADAELPCEGGSTIGIAAYSACLHATASESPYDTHTWFRDAPETRQWDRRPSPARHQPVAAVPACR